MTQQQMIESIQQIYPDMGETLLRLLLNDALDEFVEETRVLTGHSYLELIPNNDFSGNPLKGEVGSSDGLAGTVGGYSNVWNIGGSASLSLGIDSNRLSITKSSTNAIHFTGGALTSGVYLKSGINYKIEISVTDLPLENVIVNFGIWSAIPSNNEVLPSSIEITGVTNNSEKTSSTTFLNGTDRLVYPFFYIQGTGTNSTIYIEHLSIKPVDSLDRYYPLTHFNSVSSTSDVLSVFQIDLDEKPLNRFVGQINKTDVK